MMQAADGERDKADLHRDRHQHNVTAEERAGENGVGFGYLKVRVDNARKSPPGHAGVQVDDGLLKPVSLKKAGRASVSMLASAEMSSMDIA